MPIVEIIEEDASHYRVTVDMGEGRTLDLNITPDGIDLPDRLVPWLDILRREANAS